jgi:Nuclease-related domain
MTASNRSGAAHDGARLHGGAPQGASGGSARGPSEPALDAPTAWPGPVEDEAAAEAGPADAGPADAGPADAGPADAGPAEVTTADVAAADVAAVEAAAEPESADLLLWDWSPPGESDPDDLADEPADQQANPPRSEWKLVVTPVEEVNGATGTQPPGIGQRRGNLAHLAANPRLRIWRMRVVVAVLILVAFSILVSWQFGLTLAVIAIIADTIYRSRRNYSRTVRMTGAQRRTRRQLAKLRRAGYRAMNGNLIPDSREQIDHLVVGPAGVFAIDSEAWDKHLIVRTRNARQLWHGPVSMKDRLEHAHWESQQAADLLSGAMGKPVAVRPAMAVYGPKIPWDVATIREVDVFSGPRLRKYLRRRARQAAAQPLTDDEIEKIYAAANKAFPHLSSGSPAS